MSLSFDDADIYEIAHTVFGDILRVNYLIDPRVKGRITFKTVRPISSQNLLPIVSTIFRLNGVSVMEENSLYRIIPLTDINKEPVSVKYGRQSKDFPVLGFSIAQIVPLNFVSTKEMKEILTPFLSPGATITEVPGRSCLLIGDTDENMKRLLQIVEIFDDDIFKDYKVEIFVFKNLSIKDAIEEVKSVFPIFSGNSKEILKIKYLPIERLNAILVATPDDQYMDYFRKWVAKIDSIFEGAKPKIYVYPLQNRQAQQVVEILSQILGEGTSKGAAGATPPPPAANPSPSTPSSPGAASTGSSKSSAKSFKASSSALVSSETRFYFDEKNNSMVILALPKDYLFIEDLIKKIDVVPRQVLIEALIVEVTLNDALTFGVEWWLSNNFALEKNPNYKGITTTGGAGNFVFDPTSPLSAKGFTFAALDSAGVIRGLVQTLATKSASKILSSPQILVSDNHEAKIQVGDQVAIATASTTYPVAATGTTTTTSTTNTIQYKDTGVILTVKPQINDSGLVNMDIKQEVSGVDNTVTTTGLNSPNFSTRNVTTNMIVQDGKSVVLGGMIKEDRENTTSGIPILSDIPLFGYLFGYKEHKVTRTELMVIITPHVVKTIEQAVSLTEDFKSKLKGLHELLSGDKAGLVPDEKGKKDGSGK
ncbi:MAG: type II secretion system secretin GspD [Nitrospirae bacterium]|nr:type II secretion system secretin GspD [Nitrospirota bacterium]